MHTKGPWIVTELHGVLSIDAGNENGYTVSPAQINGDATDEVYGPIVRANARLIASAPSLLFACQSTLQSIEDNLPDELLPCTRSALSRAIAAATGKEPR